MRRILPSSPRLPWLLVASLLIALLLSAPLAAQTVTNSFGGLSESSDEPIDIESDLLVVQDKQKLATFKGNVKAVQGTTTLRAKELLVHYIGGDQLTPGAKKGGKTASAEPANTEQASGGDQGNAKITKIEARGDVIITSEDDQTTTSDWALYDLPSQLVTVGGNVVLTQGKNVLKGDRLVIDLKTGESRFENTGDAASGGRIRALFMPKEGEGKAEKAGTKEADGDKAKAGRGEKPAEESDEPLPLSPDIRP